MGLIQHQEREKSVARAGIRLLSLEDMMSVGGGESESSSSWYTGLLGDTAAGAGLGATLGIAGASAQWVAGGMVSWEVGAAAAAFGTGLGGVIGATTVFGGAVLGAIINNADPNAGNVGGSYNAMGDFTDGGGGGGSGWPGLLHFEF